MIKRIKKFSSRKNWKEAGNLLLKCALQVASLIILS